MTCTNKRQHCCYLLFSMSLVFNEFAKCLWLALQWNAFSGHFHCVLVCFCIVVFFCESSVFFIVNIVLFSNNRVATLNCALALSVSEASRPWLCPDGPRIHLSGPAYMPSYVQKSDFYLINVFCVVIVVKKRTLLCLAQVVLSYFVLHSNKVPLVLTTKVTYLGSRALQTAR